MGDYDNHGIELTFRSRTPEVANTSKPMRRRENQKRVVAVAKRKAQKNKKDQPQDFDNEFQTLQNQQQVSNRFFHDDISAQSTLFGLGFTRQDSGDSMLQDDFIGGQGLQNWRPPSNMGFAIYPGPNVNVLPVPKTTVSQKQFDYYANAYLPSILEVSQEDKMRFPTLVQSLLQDPLLFTATTTTSEAARWRTQSLFGDPPNHVMRGYGKTIAMLSERLRSERFAMTNAVMMTMAQLVAIETMTKNVPASGKHLAGMKQIMKARAGPDSSGTAAGYIQAAIMAWEAYFKKREELLELSPRFRPLTYPKHPFDPALSMRIADLPIGFGDIALSGSLSNESINLIEGFNGYFATLNKMSEDGLFDSPQRMMLVINQAAVCIDFVQCQRLSPIEQLICVALIAHVVRKDRLTPALTNLRNYFQLFCGYLSNTLGEADPKLPLNEIDHDNDLLKWVGAVLLVTASPDSQARTLSLKLLPKTPRPGDIIRVSQKFFWDEALSSFLVTGNAIVVTAGNDVVAKNLKSDTDD